MSQFKTTPKFDGQCALILHRPHPVVDAITRQLTQLGVRYQTHWPELPADLDAAAFNHLFYDADMGHDGQFPWAPGEAPMLSIALIGSEAPGRLAWAIRLGADAHLLKPIGSGGIFAALVIASQAFESRAAQAAELSDLRERLAGRQVLAEATACLMMLDNISADAAYERLRRTAMTERKSIEAMALQIVEQLRSGHVRTDRA
ncbi:MAG: putative response regulator [Devosia sp.]|nr:putative response regulator [Devosia sp.]